MGECSLGDHGSAGAAGTARHSPSMPAAVPTEISKAIFAGSPPPYTSQPRNATRRDQLALFYGKGLAYSQEMGLRPPRTLTGIADSPGRPGSVDDRPRREQLRTHRRVFDGEAEGLTRDDILDNVTLYWLTNTAISSARLYLNTRQVSTAGFFDPRGVKIRLP